MKLGSEWRAEDGLTTIPFSADDGRHSNLVLPYVLAGDLGCDWVSNTAGCAVKTTRGLGGNKMRPHT